MVTRPSSAGETQPASDQRIDQERPASRSRTSGPANSRVSNSSRTSNGLYTDSVPRQL